MRKLGKHKILSLFLAFIMLFSVVPINMVLADTANTVTITVNFVYMSNQAMVSQPYSAQIEKGAAFHKAVAAPKILNYSVPVDKALGLNSDITYSENTDGNGTVQFNLAAVTEDTTVTLYYVAGTADYTVKHYYQKLEDDSYEEPVIVTLTGDIDAYTDAVMASKEGYICKGVPQYTIAADGTTEVAIYYDRIYYTVVFDVNGGINGPEPLYGKYGTIYNPSDITAPSRSGYLFAGWSPEVTGVIEQDITYVAQWTPKEEHADYTVVIWGQNANDDEYSYLSSYQAWGTPGSTVTWNEDTLTCKGNHTHSLEKCYRFICAKEEHSHAASGCTLICGQESHTHTTACYEGVGNESSWGSTNKPNNPAEGQVHEGILGTYIYIKGTWYDYTGSVSSGNIVPTTCNKTEGSHTHTDACYDCGSEEHEHSVENGCYELTCTVTEDPSHTHNSSCYMGSMHPGAALWNYVRSETLTIEADGSTVLNVYFDRKEFTLTFRYNYNNGSYRSTGTITDRWGADIGQRFIAMNETAKGNLWSRGTNGNSPWTSYLQIMPAEDRTYYYNKSGGRAQTAEYYTQDLNGNYTLAFSLTAYYNSGLTISAEDFYPMEGFEFSYGIDGDGDRMNSPGSYGDFDGAKFYYNRKTYNLEFYSASNNTPDKTVTPLYQENLGKYNYTPTNKPDTVEADAVFIGWYLNPQCTGEEFDLSAHTMPASNWALYAKWVNGLYTVTTYTDSTFNTLYTYDGYNGEQDNIEKYTLADEPADPAAPAGKAFVGWFYLDSGVEKPFSFTMPITKNYDLYPKYSDQVMLGYTVHYYKAGTTEKVADDRTNTVLIGTTVTEKAKTGSELNLVTNADRFYPDKTSTSVRILQDSQEIIFYYTEAEGVPYTVKYLDAETGLSVADDKVVAAVQNPYSVVVEEYVPVSGYTARRYRITQELTFSTNAEDNVIIFYYDKIKVTINYEVVGPDGCGTVTLSSESVWILGDAAGSTATPNADFRFVGWYSDKACTNQVASYYSFTPEMPDGGWEAATYYAKFEYNLTDLTIKKTGWDELDTDQTFLFRLTADDVDLVVVVHEEDNWTTTVSGLSVGKEYTVTEISDWSWRYEPRKNNQEKNSQKITLLINKTVNTVVFENTRVEEKWLDGDSFSVNHFNGLK